VGAKSRVLVLPLVYGKKERNNTGKKKGKAIPVTDRGGP
jgi:hypothetical protein